MGPGPAPADGAAPGATSSALGAVPALDLVEGGAAPRAPLTNGHAGNVGWDASTAAWSCGRCIQLVGGRADRRGRR